jgi:homoserine/homoserine lactone efflux protein
MAWGPPENAGIMSFATWLTFFCAASFIAVSPGSGAVLSMAHGLAYGFKKASGTIMGLQAGLLVVLAIAGAGVGSLLLASEIAFTVAKVIGALYLIYLGFCQWRTPPSLAAAGADPSGVAGVDHASGAAAVPTLRRRFMIGLFTNTTNPKGIIFMVAVLPQFIARDAALLPQLGIMAVTMVAIDLTVMHSYAFAAAKMQRYFRDAKAIRTQNRLFGGILMVIGALLFFVKRVATPL